MMETRKLNYEIIIAAWDLKSVIFSCYVVTDILFDVPHYSSFVMFDCRVKFYTQEIVFFCQDLLYRMRRSCLMPPSKEETTDPFQHVICSTIYLYVFHIIVYQFKC